MEWELPMGQALECDMRNTSMAGGSESGGISEKDSENANQRCYIDAK